MSQANNETKARGPQDHESDGPRGPVIRDKRRLDPETGAVREPTSYPGGGEQAVVQNGDSSIGGAVGDVAGGARPEGSPTGSQHLDTQLAAERLEDLRRLQAEYVNYKRRVDRDRERDRDGAVGSVVLALLPVLDDIHSAREHGDLADGPFAVIADKLEATLGRFGVQRLGQVGEAFDPTEHEALMHLPEADLPDGATETTVVQVVQPGFRIGDRVVRPARVAVADPPAEAAPQGQEETQTQDEAQRQEDAQR